MPFSPQSLEEKPYNLCLNCVHIGKHCDGPNFLAMSTERWSEWCRIRKDYLGWTSARVAELSGVSKITVDRIMAGNVKDLRNTTMQAVTKALVNGSWGQYPCAMAALSEKETVCIDNPELVAKAENVAKQCEKLQAALDNMAAQHRADLAEVRAEERQKIAFLKEQIKFKEDQMSTKDKLLAEQHEFLRRKDRNILVLTTLLSIAILFIIATMVRGH